MGELHRVEPPDAGANEARGYSITREFDAPRELVWKAWTDPVYFAEWFGGPTARLENVQMNALTGGRWSATMILPDGVTIDWSGEFRELEEPERLVMAFADERALGEKVELFTVSFADLGGRTEMLLRQSGGNLTDDQYEVTRQGTSTFLDEMDALLAREQAKG
jgi:uncharacterized protein YndB with AHSA1/START domain